MFPVPSNLTLSTVVAVVSTVNGLLLRLTIFTFKAETGSPATAEIALPRTVKFGVVKSKLVVSSRVIVPSVQLSVPAVTVGLLMPARYAPFESVTLRKYFRDS